MNGHIIRKHSKSWFSRFDLKSQYAKSLFGKGSSTVILQMLLVNETSVIAELVSKEDEHLVEGNHGK